MGQLDYDDEFVSYENQYIVTELLYVYLDNIRCFKDNEFIFTAEYEINYDKHTRDLEIKETDNKIFEGFFGKYIPSINLIVGKNGSGKSTLLSFLGDKEKTKYLNKNNDAGWFTLYKTSIDNVFYIEGYNTKYLNICNNSKLGDVKEYQIIYNKENGKISMLTNYTVPTILYINKKINDNKLNVAKEQFISYFETYFSDTDEMKGYLTELLSKEIPTSYSLLFDFLNENKRYLNLIKRKDFSLNIQFSLNNFNISYFEDYTNRFFDFTNIEIYEDNQKIEESFDFKIKNIVYILIINYLYEKIISYEEDALFVCFDDNSDDKDKMINQIKNTGFFQFDKDKYEYTLQDFCCLICGFLVSFLQKSDDFSDKKILRVNELVDYIEVISEYFSNNFVKNVGINDNTYNYEVNVRFDDSQDDYYNTLKFLFALDNLIYFFEYLTKRVFNVFHISFGNCISQGELQNIISYMDIYNALNKTENQNNIILLDEPDASFHPEWITEFISDLAKMVSDEAIKKYQFIITTHSPFMLSDVPKEFVTKIDINVEDDSEKRIVSKAKKSFASNYYELIKDLFFMESTLGVFANNKIDEILNIISCREQIHKMGYEIADDKIESLEKLKISYFYIKKEIEGVISDNGKKLLNTRIASVLDVNYKQKGKKYMSVSYMHEWIENSKNQYSQELVKKLSKYFFKRNDQQLSYSTIYDISTEMNKEDKMEFRKKLNSIVVDIIKEKFNYTKIKSLISVIDEPFIRNSLSSELDRVYDLIQTSNESSDAIDYEIEMLEKRIKKLKEIQVKQNDKAK